jgi:hypothetical protein
MKRAAAALGTANPVKGQAMHRHRFSEQFSSTNRADHSTPTAQGFVLCPLPLQAGWQGQGCPWQQVYQLAFAQAQAVVKPSRLERLQANTSN